MIQTDDLPVIPLPDKTDSAHAGWDALKGLSFDDAITKIANSLVDFGFKLLIAVLVFYAGRFLIGRIFKMTRSVMVSRDVDASLTTFILSLIRIVLYFILIVTIVGILGIETSSFLALFASAGVAVGMALSGTLQNFAGGVLILLLKPYRVGDFIEAAGYTGTVKEIQIFHTVITTTDNKAIIIPNGGLSTGSINNYSHETVRRVDWTVSLAYGTDLEKAKAKMLAMLCENPKVLRTEGADSCSAATEEATAPGQEQTPPSASGTRETAGGLLGWLTGNSRRHREKLKRKFKENVDTTRLLEKKVVQEPFVALSEMADSSINFTVRAWTKGENYWPVYFEMNERFYKELPEAGFEFPFPQLDVHMIGN